MMALRSAFTLFIEVLYGICSFQVSRECDFQQFGILTSVATDEPV